MGLGEQNAQMSAEHQDPKLYGTSIKKIPDIPIFNASEECS